MNFFDYELSRTASATPPQSAAGSSTALEPTLNEEVSQVVGQLGWLWSGFRKQSQVALESARKDLTTVVAQAQKEFEHLKAEGEAVLRSATTTSGANTSADGEQDNEATSEPAPSSSAAGINTDERTAEAPASEAGVGASTAERPISSPTSTPDSTLQSPRASTSNDSNLLHGLLARAQATLPELEKRIQAAAPTREDLAALRAQADEFSARSERLLRGASAYLREAVRVVPPEDDDNEGRDGAETPEVVLDGTGLGVVVLPPSSSSSNSRKAQKGKATQRSTLLAGARAAAVLARLRREPEALATDPAADADMGVREAYAGWLVTEVAGREGAMDAPYWRERIKAELEGEDGKALVKTRDALVPAKLDVDTFWARYFFRVHQVEKDEERRKALLATSGAAEADTDDFSWEDEDDDEERSESATPSASGGVERSTSQTQGARASSDTLLPAPAASDKDKAGSVTGISYPSSLVTSPTNTSPRESSDGYDVVSEAAQGSPPQPQAKAQAGVTPTPSQSTAKAAPTAAAAKQKDKEEEESGDSDWE